MEFEELNNLINKALMDEDRLNIEALLTKKLGQAVNYNVEGYYNYHGEEFPFNGYFNINNKGMVLGRLFEGVDKIAEELHSEYHIIAGELKKVNSIPMIAFVKIPTNAWAAPIYYGLCKNDNSPEIKGDYNAVWTFDPEQIINLLATEMSNTAFYKLF
ncbi:MAG TPA: hypothetical protein VI790_03160 [Candidatus Nanoarchaeia archaeon]|nr:hypothetical protein [Candidatus Nanoarchaeia archaeon]